MDSRVLKLETLEWRKDTSYAALACAVHLFPSSVFTSITVGFVVLPF